MPIQPWQKMLNHADRTASTREHELLYVDHAGCTAPTREHELNRADLP